MSIYNPMGDRSTRKASIQNIGEMWVTRTYTGKCVEDIPRIKKEIEARYQQFRRKTDKPFVLVESKIHEGYWVMQEDIEMGNPQRWKIPTEKRVEKVVLRFTGSKIYECDENMKPIRTMKLADTKGEFVTEWFAYGFVRRDIRKIDEPSWIYHL